MKSKCCGADPKTERYPTPQSIYIKTTCSACGKDFEAMMNPSTHPLSDTGTPKTNELATKLIEFIQSNTSDLPLSETIKQLLNHSVILEQELTEWKKCATQLHGNLHNLKEVCKRVPEMNNRMYDLIGSQTLKALQQFETLNNQDKGAKE